MKTSIFSVTALALSVTASGLPVYGKYNKEVNRAQPDFPSFGNLPKSGYTNNKATNAETSGYCISKELLKETVDKYIATFSGITDGGQMTKLYFDDDVRVYSQSAWWAASEAAITKYGKKDNFPPIYENRAALIKAQTRDNKADSFRKGPVAYGCNTFSFYWKADFGNTRGRGNGIDMVFLNPKTGKVRLAYSEYNTLNQADI
ncbi:hypothetical protein FZEAL_5951 [Fusarium zealandicum]|uniref:NTF2-like domain-containing protein n=1 Tax=Fusarium zealandicum TaxID=1053134 RepID=A0A8H4XKD6_9HYPO|nr:hypothetical protein FZEAL_5951 [Fusarium zealandicum]